MKKKWFRTMDLVDEQYIAEADPARYTTVSFTKRVIVPLLASCACLVLLVCNLWLFLPYDNTPPSAKAYADSEYYPVIKQLSMLTWEKPKYKNNFQKYSAEVSDFLSDAFLAKGAMENMIMNVAPESDGLKDNAPLTGVPLPDAAQPDSADRGNADSIYEEITDNQVEGITEADRIKRSSTHIYYLDENVLKIFSIAGKDSQQVGSLQIDGSAVGGYLQEWEFYLSADCKTVTVITTDLKEEKQLCVGVVCIDVSDPTKPVEKNRLEITGNYLSSRITDGKLLLMTEFVFRKQGVDFDKEYTYLPQINGKSIAPEHIVLPEETNATRYTVVMKLDENTLATEGEAAFLSYSKDVYVSHDHIFLTHVYADMKEQEDTVVRNSMTEITCLTYQDRLEQKGTTKVRGYVKDQWSMDEYEGILRVVTTTNATTVSRRYAENTISADILSTATGNSNASLYCVDLQTFKVVASVEDFAPPREEVRSVRFDKNTAYVCTAIEVSDPVFFFDLSDLNNITYKDTGNIDGFSSSLVNIGNGFLLGIGRENGNDFKAEIYWETENGVESFCKYQMPGGVDYSEDYKSYYIDRENQLIGLGITEYLHGGTSGNYLLLHFDGYNLMEVLYEALPGRNDFKRGVYIDGFMYLFGEDTFKVREVFL